MGLEFTWDPKKAAANLHKHGISFPAAATAFGDALSITIADPDHSASEARFLLLGTTSSGQLIVVSHTERGDTIRIISARRATRRERRAYEEEG